MRQDTKNAPWKKWILPSILLSAMTIIFLSGGADYLSLQTLADYRQDLRNFVAQDYALSIITFILAYATAVALSLPGGALLTITSGFLFGAIIGGFVAVIAASLGAVALFLIARSALGATLSERAGPALEKLRDGFQQNALSYLLFLRLVPAFPFWLVNLAPALLNVRLSTYALGTSIGILPGTFAFAFLGSGLDGIIAREQESHAQCLRQANPSEPCAFALRPSELISMELLIAFVLLGFIALLPVLARRLRRGEGSASP